MDWRHKIHFCCRATVWKKKPLTQEVRRESAEGWRGDFKKKTYKSLKYMILYYIILVRATGSDAGRGGAPGRDGVVGGARPAAVPAAG